VKLKILQRCVEIDRFADAEGQKNAAHILAAHRARTGARAGLLLGVILGTKGVERHNITLRSGSALG
jgi:N-carbamoyl-L-amino-acid hydrolase